MTATRRDGNVITIRARPRPVNAAYTDARMNEHCPTCDAEPGAYCRRQDGQYRRIPCITRMKRQTGRIESVS